MAGAPTPAVLRLELFGGPVLWRGRNSIRISPYQAALLSIAYAEGSERIPRARVQRLIWGLASEKTVRHRLSQLVYQINQSAQVKVLELESEYMRVSRSLVRCDLDQFQESIDANDHETAYLMLDRRFLPALTAKRTESLSDWLDEKRHALRDRLRTSALEHWDAAEAAHDWIAARATAEVLLRLNPNEELVLRRVMRAHAMTGQVREVEANYRAFAERAAPDGEWVPEPETLELLREFKPEQGTSSVQDPARNRDPGANAPFLGRQKAIAPLSNGIFRPAAWLKTLAVEGGAGSGKTRLVRELLRSASLRGYRIVSASPAELEAGIPLSLLLDVSSALWVKPIADELPAPWMPILRSMLPMVHAPAARLPTTQITDFENLPRPVYEAFLHLFTATAEEHRTILFLDDFHWADLASVRLLQFLARRWKSGDFTLLLAYRPEELRVNGAVHHWLSLLKADPTATVVTLDTLEDEPARKLARGIAVKNVSDAAIEQVVNLAGGNPRYLVDLAANSPAEAKGGLYRGGAMIPLSVERSLIRRARDLSDHARKAVASLSVLGKDATFAQLLRIADCSHDDCAGALEELQHLGLVGWSNNGVRIPQAIVGTAIYEKLSPARRMLLHARVAELLKEQPDSAPLELIAVHYFWSGNHDLAHLYATEAVNGSDPGDIARRLHLLSVAYEVSTGNSQSLVAASLAKANHRARRLRTALSFGEEALRTSRTSAMNAVAETRLIVADTRHRLGLDGAAAALQELDEVEAFARKQGDDLLRACVLEARVQLLDREGDHESVARQLARIGALKPMGDPAARSQILATLSRFVRYGDPDGGILSARKAVDIARAEGLKGEEAIALHALGRALMAAGRLAADKGFEILEQGKAACRATGRCDALAMLLLAEADWRAGTGDDELPGKALAEAATIVQGMDCPEIRAREGIVGGNLALAAADIEGAKAALDRVRAAGALADEAGSEAHAIPTGLLAAFGGLEGNVLLESGKIGLAATVAERHPLDHALEHAPRGLILFHARLKSRTGDLPAATELLEQAATALEASRPMSWLRIALELVRVARRSGVPRPELATAARARATELALPALAQKFVPFCGE